MNPNPLPLLTALLATALGACAGHPSDQVHSVEDYYANDQLTAETLEACRARNEAEMRLMAAKPACRNAREAERRRAAESAAAYNAEWNSYMEQQLRLRRQAREEDAARRRDRES